MCIFALSLCYFGYRYLLKQTQNYVNVDGQGAVITGCDTGKPKLCFCVITLSQTTNLELFQTRDCRRHFQI